MSHFTKLSIAAQQKYEAELVAALKQHFGEKVEVHDKPVDLLTWNGATSGLKANLVVRKKEQGKKLGYDALSNDLGYERNTNDEGYTVHADEAGFPKASQDLVAQYYAKNVAMKQLQQQGYSVTADELPNGDIRLLARQY